MKNSYPNIFTFNKKILKKVIISLNKSGVAGLPTETVYGLGGNAYSKKSVKKADSKKSTLVYSHENNYAFKKKGVRHVHKEKILDGAKGLSFKFVMKVGDDDKDFYKVHVRQQENGKFTVEEKSKGKETKKEEVYSKEIAKVKK